jgi:hypothetical protein
MADPGRTETSLAGAGQHSSDDSRQVLPLNHPNRARFRVAAVLAAVIAAVWTVVTVGVSARVTIAMLVVAAAVVLVSLLPGNLGAAASTALGGLILLLGLAQLAITATSLNVLHASILNVVGFLLLGLTAGTCGLYEWETDDHGRMIRQLRRRISGDARDAPPGWQAGR